MSFKISIDDQANLFKSHLEAEDNDRIIFSGPFGIGKTYFLDEFFDVKKKDYLTVKLAPINYSVSSNEDIFKLIKYDILFELGYTHGLSFESEPVSRAISYGTILPGKIDEILKVLLPLLPLLNKSADAIPIVLTTLAGLSSTVKDIEKQRNETGEETDATNLGREVASGYQYESDYATEFIENSLNRLAAEKGACYKTLVIDDLDRIDPEHIFRLFNIFSAHLDYNKTQRNKFGFDKVIFVCDIHNVRNIFHTRYGTDTDFTGYIDKFFSQEIFFFSNEAEVGKAVNRFINEIRFTNEYDETYFHTKIISGRNRHDAGILAIILTELILSGALKIRRLKASYRMLFQLSEKTISVPGTDERLIRTWQMPGVVVLQILARIMGGADALIRAIQIVIRYRRSNEYHSIAQQHNDWLLGTILPVADFHNHKFIEQPYGQLAEHAYQEKEGKFINYSLIGTGSRPEIYYAKTNSDVTNINFFEVLKHSVEQLMREGILR